MRQFLAEAREREGERHHSGSARRDSEQRTSDFQFCLQLFEFFGILRAKLIGDLVHFLAQSKHRKCVLIDERRVLLPTRYRIDIAADLISRVRSKVLKATQGRCDERC